MTEYVETNYSANYVEGDTPPQNVVSCDISQLLSDNQALKQQNELLLQKIDALFELSQTLLTKVNSNNQLNLNIVDKVTNASSKLDALSQTMVTTDYIDNKVPFVDDLSLAVYPKGTSVVTKIASGMFVVESSKLLPDGNGAYTIVYTLSKEIDGVKRFSEFHSSYVLDVNPDDWIPKSQCTSLSS